VTMRRLRSSPSRQRGFTLIELSVALAAGLIVGLAVVGLSKEATNTFHEEMRAATAQMSARTAIDRLRSDVARASFMSSPNVYGDPAIVSSWDPTAQLTLQLRRLAGIRLFPGGSKKLANIGMGFTSGVNGTDDGAIAFSGNNNLNPDALDITGNLNTVDSFTVQTTGAGGCGGTRFILGARNPPAYRLMNTPGANGPVDALARAFQPIAGHNFMARLQDLQGRVQFLEVCATGFTGGAPALPYVDVSTNPVAASGTTNVGGGGGFLSGATLNPVLTIRYRLAPTLAQYNADLNAAADATRFDLYRFYIDSTGAEIAGSAADPPPELVAEYAVDLKFAFTVDNTAFVAGSPPTATRTHISYAFGDDANNGAWGVSPTAVATPAPQRIRSVRIRLGTRTALADRQKLVSPNPAYSPVDYTNLFRYCTVAASPCDTFARVRTAITEVTLNNQARALYP
jgi:prepilin-type N-terminal cleavage/methylation domain-containing protein